MTFSKIRASVIPRVSAKSASSFRLKSQFRENSGVVPNSSRSWPLTNSHCRIFVFVQLP